MWKLALIFLLLATGAARADPVVFMGNGLSIVHDGSQTAYNPHSEAGRRLLTAERESCCVEAPKSYRGQSEPFAFHSDTERHLSHEAARFVINSRTGSFVSSTTLQKSGADKISPDAYVDSDITPMVALSDQQIAACQCKPGDRVLVTDRQFNRSVWTVYGENAGDTKDGLAHTELSPAAAAALLIGLDPLTKEPKESGYKLMLTAYPGSGYGPRFPHGPVPPVHGAQ